MRLGALTVAIGLATAAPAAATPNIVGGTAVGPGALPSMAYLAFASGSDDFSCTGTVIAPTLVLTAAHCAEAGATTYRVVIGVPDIDDATPGDVHRVSSTAVDPAWTGVPGTNDAAVLTLATPTAAPAVALAAPSATAAAITGSPAVIAGWGATAGGQQPPSQLMDAPSVVQSPAYCASAYADFEASDQLCALDVPRDDTSTCQGDSGGPLFAVAPGRPAVQVGITAFQSPACDPGIPDVFTAIAAVSPWIVGEIQAAGQRPVRLTAAAVRGGLRAAIGATLHAQHASVHRASRRRLRCTGASGSQRTCLVTFRAGRRAYVGTIVVSGRHTAAGVPDTDVTFTLRWWATDCRAAPRPAGTTACTTHPLRRHLVIPQPTT